MARYRFIKPLPMAGEAVSALATSSFYPFLLPLNMEAMPRGGKIAEWWWRVREWKVNVSWTATVSDFLGEYPQTGAHEFILVPNSETLVPPVFMGDERDRKNRIFCRWGGGADSAVPLGSFAGAELQLMPEPPTGLFDWIGHPGTVGPSFYRVGDTHVAPLIVFLLRVGHHSDTAFGTLVEFPIRNYQRNTNDAGGDYPGGSKPMGSCAFDGFDLPLHARADNPQQPLPELDSGSSLDTLSVSVVPYTWWSWEGLFDTGNGSLLLPSTEYEDEEEEDP